MNNGYINFLSAKLFAEVSAMNAENEQRKVLGDSMAYDSGYYYELISKYEKDLERYISKINEYA